MDILHTLPDPAVRVLTLMLALFPLVLIHEFGHFLLAKLNRIRVEEFGIGFPPRLVRLFRADGTDYTINWLPIGGFVRLAGEDDPSEPDSFAAKSKRARAAVLLAGPMANFLLAALIFIIVAVPEEIPTVHGVSVAGLGTVAGTDASPAKTAGLVPYDIIVAVDGQPILIPNETDPAKRALATLETLQRATDAHAGQNMRLTVLRGIQAVPVSVAPDSIEFEKSTLPGITGDRVTAAPANGPVRVGDILVNADGVNGLEGGLLALRGIDMVERTVTPVKDSEGKGRMGVQITPAVVPLSLPALAAVKRGVLLTAAWMQTMVKGLAEMVVGRQPVALAGPVKISEMSRDISNQGLDKFLLFMALLSINLGVINLLPIPALDGGRLLFIFVEGVRGRRVEPAREALVHMVGFVLVIGLMVVMTAVEVTNVLQGR
jgi:regulator of sigma E protease